MMMAESRAITAKLDISDSKIRGSYLQAPQVIQEGLGDPSVPARTSVTKLQYEYNLENKRWQN